MFSNRHDISRIDSTHWKALRPRSSPERDILVTYDEGSDGPSALPLAEGIRLSKTSSECLYFQTAEMKKEQFGKNVSRHISFDRYNLILDDFILAPKKSFITDSLGSSGRLGL